MATQTAEKRDKKAIPNEKTPSSIPKKAQKAFDEICRLEKELKVWKDTFDDRFNEDKSFVEANEEAKEQSSIACQRRKEVYQKHPKDYKTMKELKVGVKEAKLILKDMVLAAFKEQIQLSLFDEFRVKWTPEIEVKLVTEDSEEEHSSNTEKEE